METWLKTAGHVPLREEYQRIEESKYIDESNNANIQSDFAFDQIKIIPWAA